MKPDEQSLEKIYERDKTTGAFVISVAIEKYADIFNELDSSPFLRRDLNNHLRRFLEDCSSDIPLKNDIIVQFNVSQEKQDIGKEEKIKTGLKTYFSFVRNSQQKKVRNRYQKSTLYALASFLLLSVSYSLRTASTGNIVFNTLVDGVNIGGWVFLWEAISTFAFKNRNVHAKYKHYKRFNNTPIRFNYLQKETN